jgi:hypothetical protein
MPPVELLDEEPRGSSVSLGLERLVIAGRVGRLVAIEPCSNRAA